ncbi:hypothetical protein FRB95_001933 [Tulasnella sp. JGI-2019a]|nr:hypothetical protein FRB95_001933 [Tulasnella sp. JGI-2019a]
MCASPTAVRVRFGLPSDEIISICSGIIDRIFLSFHGFFDFFHQRLPLSRSSVSESLSLISTGLIPLSCVFTHHRFAIIHRSS